jgi:hypothetical protein
MLTAHEFISKERTSIGSPKVTLSRVEAEHTEFMNGYLPLDGTPLSFSLLEIAEPDVLVSFPSSVAIPGARIRD